MTVALMHGLGKPVVKVGRIAGQFAKPRSSDYEEVNGQKIASYRGDMVNSMAPNETSRIPDPSSVNQNLIYYDSLRDLVRFGTKNIIGGSSEILNCGLFSQDNSTPLNSICE